MAILKILLRTVSIPTFWDMSMGDSKASVFANFNAK